MNQVNQTIKRIEAILTSKYDATNFTDLIREIFPSVNIVAPDIFRKEFTNFSSHIEGSYHVGNYSDPDGKKLIIHAVQLKKESYVENSRSTQRSYAKKLMEAGNADAAIIAFFTEGDPKWRMSFVRLDYEIKFENGKLNTSENMTPAKRYSYLVGQDEPCHTAISRFRRFITDDSNVAQPTLDDLEEAFSVEKVTEEFFNLYCEKFHQLRESLEANPDFVIEAEQHNFTSAQFAKKLMGQIVFLYFLQKKGWLGVSAWPKEMNAREYKKAFFARGAKSRELIPRVYVQVSDDHYKLSGRALNELSDEDETVLASCVKGNAWGTGSKTFMRTLFDYSQRREANFFDAFLEPLFYDALNVNRGEQGYDPALHCRIPFLSGGLFEPIDGYDWKHNDFAIPNEVFSNKAEKGDRDADGILDIFDRYNFTMSEDEPLEREVAIDPEMLGKVFENLLEVQDRKSKGAFYTPREIVHYMCQETLISYLRKETGLKEQDVRDFILLGDFLKDEDTAKNRRQGEHDMLISEEIFKIDRNGNVIVDRLRDIDNALANIRVADPAVGSGAFPLGMLNEIVRARQNISAYMAITMDAYHTRMMYNNERSPYALKLQTIKNCIFAADIEPSAVDIAQLRLWLSLVIDDEINPDANSPLDGHKNPIPLPNLECNIVCGNSLIDEFEGIKLINFNDSIGTSKSDQQQNLFQNAFDAILPSLLEAQDALFRCDDTVKKQELREKIEALKDEIIRSQMQVAPPEAVEKYRIARNEASKPFVLWQIDFARVFREKGGFDIVIGNPPYVGEKGNKELFRPIAATEFGRKYYCGKMDLFYFFFHKAIDLGKQNAEIAFITTNYYPTAFGGKVLREDFKDRTQIRKLINFNELKIFESALGQHNMITLLTKDKTNRVISQNCICRVKGTGNARILDEVLHAKETKHEYFDYYEVTQEDLYDGAENYIRIAGCGVGEANSINSILAKIAASPHCLKDIAYIKQGIVSGADKYTDAHERKYHLGFIKGTGIFVLNKEEIEDLNLPDRERSFVKGVYKNSQVSKYHIDYTDELKVLYITKDIQENEAPTIINHLKKFKPILESKRETQEGKIPWYSLHWPRDKFLFESEEKIVNSRRAKQNIFAIETKKSYEQSDLMITVIRPEYHADYPPKYVLALLNSKLYYVWLKNKGKLKGDMLEIYGTPLEEIPVQIASETQREKIISLVESLLSDPDDNEAMNTLDEEIYQIFDLTESEKELVRAYCE